MHLILFLPEHLLSQPELDEFVLPESNPHGRLYSDLSNRVSLTSDIRTQPAKLQPGTLYAYVNVKGVNDDDQRATLRVEQGTLYPTLVSLRDRFGELWKKGCLHAIEPKPVELLMLGAPHRR